MRKVVLFTPMLQPYRITFYEKLNRSFNNGLSVFYIKKNKDDGRPEYRGDVDFKSIGFNEKKIKIGPFLVKYIPKMMARVKAEKPDVLILQSISGIISLWAIIGWAKKNKVKVVYWTCGWESDRAKGVLLTIKRILVSVFYRMGDYHLAYSTNAKNYCIDRGVSAKFIDVCYNGIEIDGLKEKMSIYKKKGINIRSKNGLSQKDIIYLYVGGLFEDKKVLFLLDVFKCLDLQKNVHLWIVGDGPQKDLLLKKIKSDSRIHYFGRIIEGVESYFETADFFVLPGAGGLAINQALYFGAVPIVSCAADGTQNDLVTSDTGFIFKENDLKDLRDKMKNAFDASDDDLRLMRLKGKKIIEERSNVDQMVTVFIRCINSLFD